MKLGLTLGALLNLLAVVTHAAPLLTINPGGVSGGPGATVGWGFTLTNPTDYLVVTSSSFCAAPVGLPVCNPSTVGSYTDIISSNFFVVGPAPDSTVVTQSFVNGVSGLGSIQLNFGAILGTVESGTLLVTYDLYSRSPNAPGFDPVADGLQFGQSLTANATITVSSSVPEPGTWGSAVLAVVLLASHGRTRRGRNKTVSPGVGEA